MKSAREWNEVGWGGMVWDAIRSQMMKADSINNTIPYNTIQHVTIYASLQALFILIQSTSTRCNLIPRA